MLREVLFDKNVLRICNDYRHCELVVIFWKCGWLDAQSACSISQHSNINENPHHVLANCDIVAEYSAPRQQGCSSYPLKLLLSCLSSNLDRRKHKNTGISYYPAAEGHIFPFKDRLPSHPLETIPELYSIGQNSACASKPYHRLRLCSRSRETQLFWRFGQNKGSSRFSVVIIHQLSVRLRSWKLMLGSHRHEKECGSCIRQLEECYLMRLV